MTRPETRKDVSKWLGISFGTIRLWDSRFSSWLESPPGVKGKATKKRYTENDLIVFLAIRNLRRQNKTFDQIETYLKAEILKTSLPEWGEGVREQPTSELVTTNRQLTTQLIEVSNDLAAAKARAETIERERDRLLNERDRLLQDAQDARERATVAETELRIQKEQATPETPQDAQEPEPPEGENLGFWGRLFNRG